MADPPDPRRRPIAVFDSGVGGLTVLHELLVSLPGEDFVYLGDTARFPYGTRPPEEVQRFALEVADVLLEAGAKLLVVACNAASSTALRALERRCAPAGLDVLGVVTPASQLAVARTHTGRIGVLATPTTVASGAYEEAIRAADPARARRVGSVPRSGPDHPGRLPLRRAGGRDRAGVLRSPARRGGGHRDPGVHALSAGRAHAPADARPGVGLVTSGAALARQAERALAARDLLNPQAGEGSYRFLCTGDVDAFRALGTRFLQMPLGDVVHVEPRALAA